MHSPPFVPAKAGTQSYGSWPLDSRFRGNERSFAALSPRCRAARSVRELERDHAGDDERGAEPAPEARGVAEKPHPHQEGSGGADAGPHRVGGAERDVPLRQKEQAAADRERDDRYRRADDGPPGLLRPLEPDRPADLAQSGDNQICPGDRHVLRPLSLRFTGTIAKDDSRFVTARSASVGTDGGAARRWRMARGALLDCVSTRLG